MKLAKVSFVNEPFAISRARIPFSESAGRIEYLTHILETNEGTIETFTFFLGQKKTFEQLGGLGGHTHNPSPYAC